MTVEEAVNRATNLVAASVCALAGFAFAPEIMLEKEAADRTDDILLLLLGIIAIIWYKRGVNRFKYSVAPVLLVGAGLLIKFGAILIEFKDKEDVGDDFGGLILFILATIYVFWLYKKAKTLAASNS